MVQLKYLVIICKSRQLSRVKRNVTETVTRTMLQRKDYSYIYIRFLFEPRAFSRCRTNEPCPHLHHKVYTTRRYLYNYKFYHSITISGHCLLGDVSASVGSFRFSDLLSLSSFIPSTLDSCSSVFCL